MVFRGVPVLRARVLRLFFFVLMFFLALFCTIRFCGAAEESFEAAVSVEAPDPLVEGVTVCLIAETSGAPQGWDMEYAWLQTGGTEVELMPSSGVSSVEFVAPAVGAADGVDGLDLQFDLSVTALSGDLSETAGASVTVKVVNLAPEARAGPDQSVFEGTAVTLDGSNSSDPEGHELLWQWASTTEPPVAISGSDGAVAQFTAPDVGPAGKSFTFRLTVTDAAGVSDADTCVVWVNSVNGPPVAHAGGDRSVEESEEVSLDGSGSYDPDGDVLTWSWTQEGGMSVELSDPAVSSPTFTAPNVGMEGSTLDFRLVVTDTEGLSDQDRCLITVLGENELPYAEAGEMQEVGEGERVVLDGSGSGDPEGGVLIYQWVQTDGPGVDLANSEEMKASFTAPQVGPAGAYLAFDLFVEDEGGLKARDYCYVDVVDVEEAGDSSAGDGGSGGGCAKSSGIALVPGIMVLAGSLLISGVFRKRK